MCLTAVANWTRNTPTFPQHVGESRKQLPAGAPQHEKVWRISAESQVFFPATRTYTG